MSHDANHDTVLLVCDDASRAEDLLSKFYAKGWSVLGPVSSAAMALSVTAQSCPTIAVVAGRISDDRRTPDFANTLMRTWGVRTLILDEDGDEDDVTAFKDSWAAKPGQEESVRHVIGA